MKGIKLSTAILALAFVGCGGQGGVGTGFPDPPVAVINYATGPGVPGGTTLRTYRAGDTWEYSVSGTMLREEFDESAVRVSRNQGPINGSMIRTVTAVNVSGVGPCFKVSEALTYTVNGGLPTVEVIESYMTQSSVTGDVTMVGRRLQKADATGLTQAWLPGTFGVGASVGGASIHSGTLPYPGTTFDVSTAFAVTGGSTVVPDTNPVFETWRSLYTDTMHNNWDVLAWYKAYNISNGFVFKSVEDISSVDEWSPVIGAPVKRTYNSSRRDSVIHGAVNYSPPTFDSQTGNLTTPESITYAYHTIHRTLNAEMLLKRRSLQ